MPQSRKLTTKARMPPKVKPKKAITKSNDKLHATSRKNAPKKAKLTKRSLLEYQKGEKAIRANIETEVRSRAISSMPTNLKSSAGDSKGQSSKHTTVKNILRNLKK